MNTSWESSWRITGERGTLMWDGANDPVGAVVDESQAPAFIRPTKPLSVPLEWDGREGHWGCLDEMFASIAEGRAAETDCHDNIKSVAMVFGAIESAKSGRKVML